MGKGKIEPLKKFVKGVNAATGILSQPPGTVVRISNLNFTQRGSLQTIDGSAVIGQLVSPNTQAAALGTFSSFVSGQYPYYLALSSTVGYLLPNLTGVTAAAVSGSPSNPAGTYLFALCATNGSQHSDPQLATISISPGIAFNGAAFTWTMDASATSYSIYYLPGGPGSTEGVLLGTSTGGGFNFIGHIPATPLVELPVGNNTFLYQLQIGNIQPPSKRVWFTPTANTFPAALPQPAQVAPGDPNFQFQEGFQNVNTYTGADIPIFEVVGNDTVQNTAGGYPSLAISGSQTVILELTAGASGAIVDNDGTGSFLIEFQYSTDGGATWNTIYSISTSIPGGYDYPAFPLSQIITGLTNLSDLKIAITITTTATSSAVTIADALISASSVTVTTGYSFTPYGGSLGYADPIPQILQFAAVTTGIPALPITVAILILGNGYAPQQFDPTLLGSSTCTALTNTFTSLYPGWQASVNWALNDIIAVTVSGTTYTFLCTQAGLSAASEPTFPATLGVAVDDGQAVWKNTGTLPGSIAPRGAAHGIVYGGSLWLYNTAPQTTQDQIDGPTCLKMSDSGNPNSWNPANIAFLGKDDGTQGTGMTTFSIAQVGVTPTESLVCFKEFQTYQVLGIFGAADFQIIQAQTDLGCIAKFSIQFLAGYGIVRLTHEGFGLFNGVNDKLISEEIRPYLYGGTGLNADIVGIDFTFCYLAQSAQTSRPPQYLCACPLVATTLTGVTSGAVPGDTGSHLTFYILVTKLVPNGAGVYTEVAITPEMIVTTTSILQGVGVFTPEAQAGVQYRAYWGTTPGGENTYVQASSFNGALPIGGEAPGGTPGTPTVFGTMTRLFLFDLVLKAWTIIDLPWSITVLLQARTGEGNPLTIGFRGDGTGALERFFAGDASWDAASLVGGLPATATPIAWGFQCTYVYEEGSSRRIFYRKVTIRGYSTQTAASLIAVGVRADGNPVATFQTYLQPQPFSGQFQLDIDLMFTAQIVNIAVSGVGPVTIDGMDFEVVPKKGGEIMIG
jgi:hypothetical protein